MKQRFSEVEILGFLRAAKAGVPVMDLCWNHCFSRSTFRAWKAKYGAALNAKTVTKSPLEVENARLRNALARAKPAIDPQRKQNTVEDRLARRASIASYLPTDVPGRATALQDAD